MPISFRRYKKKATKYIDDHYRGTGQGTLNHDLKMYLDMPEFRPLFDQSVQRINRGEDEDNEIENMIRELARSTLTTAREVAQERGLMRRHPKVSVERHYVDDTIRGKRIRESRRR